MLILTRKISESIRIGDDITVTIISGGSRQISIGIDAPEHVAVHREEVYQRILDGGRLKPKKH